MKRLEDMTFGQRAALTVVICLVILFALALFGYLTGGWDEADAAPFDASPYDARIAEIEREAVDAAFAEHVRKLYGVWMADPGNVEAPRRAGKGAQNGRRAYIDAMGAIDLRAPQRH
jgi:hypothetical protein